MVILYTLLRAWIGLALLIAAVEALIDEWRRRRTLRRRDYLSGCIRVEPERPMPSLPRIDVPAWPPSARIPVEEIVEPYEGDRGQQLRLGAASATYLGREASAADISRCVHELHPPLRALSDDWRFFSLYRRN